MNQEHSVADLERAHRHSSAHQAEILAGELCGCFYCESTLSPAEIEEWIGERDDVLATAMCPRCGIDSVIGSRAGFPLTPNFLKAMNQRWF